MRLSHKSPSSSLAASWPLLSRFSFAILHTTQQNVDPKIKTWLFILIVCTIVVFSSEKKGMAANWSGTYYHLLLKNKKERVRNPEFSQMSCCDSNFDRIERNKKRERFYDASISQQRAKWKWVKNAQVGKFRKILDFPQLAGNSNLWLWPFFKAQP